MNSGRRTPRGSCSFWLEQRTRFLRTTGQCKTGHAGSLQKPAIAGPEPCMLVHKFTQMSPRNAHKHSTLCNGTDLSDRSTSIRACRRNTISLRSWALQLLTATFLPVMIALSDPDVKFL